MFNKSQQGSKLSLVQRIKQGFSRSLLPAVLFAGTLFSSGCGTVGMFKESYPQKFTKPPLELIVNKETKVYAYPVVKPSKTNKYALLIKGKDNGITIDGDIENTAKLLLLKNYDVYYAHTSDKFYISNFCDQLSFLTDEDSKFFIFLTGHGNSKGFSLKQTSLGMTKQIKPFYLFSNLNKVYGKKAVLVQFCRSGIFYDCLKNNDADDEFFRGVLITACGSKESHVTDPFREMSAFSYGFCNFFDDNPIKEYDLSKIKFKGEVTPLTSMGMFFQELFGMDFSLVPRIYSTTTYKF